VALAFFGSTGFRCGLFFVTVAFALAAGFFGRLLRRSSLRRDGTLTVAFFFQTVFGGGSRLLFLARCFLDSS
jgi:hypothetical protein